ncbi:adenosylcobinamide-GDP ribazoletransferase, partial [bacterium]
FLNFEPFISNTILIVLLIIFTGGLHLDGLADTADAFLSRKTKEEMLKIMHDSHIGAMGVLSLICILLLKIAFLSSISPALKTIGLLLMCTLSRWTLVFSMFLFPYARNEGKAKVFAEGVNFKIFISATIITLTSTLIIWRLKGLFVFGIIAMSTYIISKFINNKIGGITGDTLGAINELTEVIALFSIYIL